MDLTKDMLICINRHMCLTEPCELCHKDSSSNDNECKIWLNCDIWFNEQMKIVDKIKE